MYIATIINTINIFVWLLPPFRQLKGGYFLYFIILAFSDPIGLFLIYKLKLHPDYRFVVHAALVIIVLLHYAKKLNYVYTTVIGIITVASLFFLPQTDFDYVTFLFSLYACLIVGEVLIKETFTKGEMSIYLLMIIFYQFTVALKFLVMILDYSTGIYFFGLSTAVEVLIAVFFIFYNKENSPAFHLSKETA